MMRITRRGLALAKRDEVENRLLPEEGGVGRVEFPAFCQLIE